MIDKDLDLAILDFNGHSSYKFEPARPQMRVGSKIRILGFPKWSPGATLSEAKGEICGFRKWHQHLRAMVTCRIIEGASGAPVLDSYNRVIGIAAQGASSFQDADAETSDEFGIISISDLDKLILNK